MTSVSLCRKIILTVLAAWSFRCVAEQHWVGIGNRVVAWTNSTPANRVRLGVRDEGVYRVTAEEIATAAGVSAEDVRSALTVGGLALSNGVSAVAWTTEGSNVYFFGQATTELFAPENVYWLSLGPGVAMEAFDATPEPESSTNQWFMSSKSYRSSFVAPYDARDRRSSIGTLTNVLNFGKWIPGSSVEATRAKAQTVTLPGFFAAAATGAVARVSVVSYYDFATPDNQVCEVWLNGTNCGSQSWSGEQALTFECAAAQGVVTNGPLQIKIRNGLTAQVNDFMLLDPVICYPRAYAAVSNVLLCTGGAAQTVAVSGLATNAVCVWDVTEPKMPLVLDAPVWPSTNGQYNVAFLCGGATARYAVFAAPAGCYAPSVSGVRNTDWSNPAEMPQLAIVIPPRRWITGFDAAVQPLATLRNAQGLRTRVIDAEELYNAFTDGLVHPDAFRRFCRAGVTSGSEPILRYLLFAGYGSSDYKLEVSPLDKPGLFPALFPLYLFSQVEASAPAALMLPNDSALGDATGDAVPEVAVGRFLATNAVELTCMVTKTIQYDRVATWKSKAIFAACAQNFPDDINFSNVVAQTVSGYQTGGWTAKAFYPPAPSYPMNVMWDNTYDSPPTGAKNELGAGAGFLYYFGHSSDTLLGNSELNGGVLRFANASMLQAGAWPFAPVAFFMGCRVGRWTILDFKTRVQCTAEACVRNPTSGFAAVISSAGYMDQPDAVGFSNGFRDAIAAGAVRLGDAWCAAFAAMGGTKSEEMQSMSLLGDPSLCISATVTPRGTSTAWMIAEGLTNSPAEDLQDHDNDGFATWQEVQAGTDYRSKALRISEIVTYDASSGVSEFTFEPVIDTYKHFRVFLTTNLVSNVWEPVPWKANLEDAWSLSGIPAAWPVETVLVPFRERIGSAFYKMESCDE